MKKLTILALALMLAAAPASAQKFGNALKKAATAAADKVTHGKLTATAMHGTWNYKAPAVKMESNDLAAEVGGAALEGTISQKLEKAYTTAGIKPGACTFIFNNDNTFTAKVSSHELSGKYEFDAEKHLITLHFAKGKLDLGSMPGHVYISGSDLSLVFPVTKLVGMVSKLGTKVASLESVVTMLEKYKNFYVGFGFTK